MFFDHEDDRREAFGGVEGLARLKGLEQVLAYEQWEDGTELSVSDLTLQRRSTYVLTSTSSKSDATGIRIKPSQNTGLVKIM